MSYATTEQLSARIGESEVANLTLGLTPPADTDKLAQALQDAEALIDSYLGKRYKTPVAIADAPILEAVACDIARFYLYTDHPTEAVQTRYKQRVMWLAEVAVGKISLGLADNQSAPGRVTSVTRTDTTRSLTKESMAGY